ncbi:hypothetical protein AC626_03730 [Pseudoalteromonas rubra]|uniref:Uncharacterized protein n=1 Tax=Pseudoalteromonas rubra TaxID=43658 RepID=A0A0L0EXT1_9GAMM|nr:hypothetical protein AC626_03730 [Pseudoalteromonas rubra]
MFTLAIISGIMKVWVCEFIGVPLKNCLDEFGNDLDISTLIRKTPNARHLAFDLKSCTRTIAKLHILMSQKN